MDTTYPAGWAARVCVNLFPLSIEKSDLAKALKEWAQTGDMIDHMEAKETCEMCGKQPIRYHFEIANDHTDKTLWVGSECIEKFGVDAVLPDGTRVSGDQAVKVVRKNRAKMIEDARKGRVEQAIKDVIDLEDKDYLIPILYACLNKHREGKPLSPKLMNTLAWRLRVFKVPHSPGDFRVSLRRASHKYDLGSLDDFQAKGLMPYLSVQQRENLLSTRPQLGEVVKAPTQVHVDSAPKKVDESVWTEIFADL